MSEGLVSRAFRGRRRPEGEPQRLPPGQYLVEDFPVLTAGVTPYTPQDRWSFSIEAGDNRLTGWTWDEFLRLPAEDIETDIHCVTRWSKYNTRWRGVSVDTVLRDIDTSEAAYIMAFCDGGYTTNLPLADVTGGKAWVAYSYDGGPLPVEHGGPARLLVPHLYFWKSAKWVRGLRLMREDQRGFWEMLGYHDRGDPWREQRYWGD